MNNSDLNIANEVLGERQSIVKRVFGCWHLKLSLPTTKNNITYRFCVKCGMRKQYDLDTFTSKGAFYSTPVPEDVYFV